MTKTPLPPSGELVSIALTRHMLDLTAWQGVPQEAVLAAAGLTEDDLGDRDGYMPVARGREMLHEVLRRTGDPVFYLKLSQSTFISGYGIIGYLLESSPTLKEAILALLRYERLISTVAFSHLEHQPGRVLWGLEFRHDDPVLVRHMTEFYLGCRYLFLLMVKEKRSKIVSAVHFRHPAPASAAAREEYRNIFRCPVHFDQPESALILQPQALGLPLRQVEVGLREMLEAHADRKMTAMMTATESLRVQVREQLRMLMQRGHPSRELVAERLGISSRHLSRQLQAEGCSYRDVLDELRLELAQASLRASSRTIDEIGRQLNFADGQTFGRWFRLMTGQAPGDFRQVQGRGAAEAAAGSPLQ